MKTIFSLFTILLSTCFPALADTWTAKADFAGTGRNGAVGFSINGKGYIPTGSADEEATWVKSVWEYDPLTDVWTQKADLPGDGRQFAAGFSIENKGYIGTGWISNNKLTDDFWEYDSAINTWTQKASFPGGNRIFACAFSIGNKGYMGAGSTFSTTKKTFWEYDPATDQWTKIADYGGGERANPIGFTIGNKAYVGTGQTQSSAYTNDIWEYDPSSNIWAQKSDFPGGARASDVAFSINGLGYVGLGYSIDSGFFNDFWQYNPITDGWIQKADYIGLARYYAVGFSIGNNGYIGTGYGVNSSQAYLNEFYQYAPDCGSVTVYADADIDSYGDGSSSLLICDSILPAGYVYNNTDCNDANLSVYPGATEVCSNGIDDNCNGLIDENCCTAPTDLANTNITNSKVTLSWNEVTGAVKYNVRYKVSGTNPWTRVYSASESKSLNGLDANTKYTWQVRTICSTNPPVKSAWSLKKSFTTSLRLSDEQTATPFEAHPNPFSSSTVISFSLSGNSYTTIELLDLAGRKIKTLLDENLDAGDHHIPCNRGQLVAGIYFIRAKVNDETFTMKIIIE